VEKTYNPEAIESYWYKTWEDRGYFRPVHGNDPYCIMLPPPNVTGSLHMGHAFQQTLMDILIRYHRMQGYTTLWQCGTDHAGIATQMVVERQLESQGKSRHELGRSRFIDAVWKWKGESGNFITRQSRRLGTSMDWSRECFTMDAGLSEAVTNVFVQLFEEGLIYRGKRLVNWDPVLLTAISDLEVVSEEEDGFMWHIRYPQADGKGQVVVATTRPETMLGDAAVAVHPEDRRYRNLVGRELVLPLAGRHIPVIADEYVDPEFGTGCVKITPAHDFNDYRVWERHKDTEALKNLPLNGLINIFAGDAKLLHEPDSLRDTGCSVAAYIPEAYRGLDRFEARRRIVNDLEKQSLLEKVVPHKLMVPRGDRSGAVIEPYLTDQWYVRIRPLAEPAVRAVETGQIRFVPDNWSKTYFEWMQKIEDWCISRQLWWGHRIPAWYDEQNNVYAGRDEEDVRTRHQLDPGVRLRQDEDVLDTWFSSALWPFSTLGWPKRTRELETFYPTSVLVTGFDIIFFWVARMIMMGLKFMGDVPFREVYIHGLVRDSEGQKMSKSKGNILDPLDLIDGIDLETLVRKRTTGLMRPQDAARIEESTRREFPNGIDAYGTDSLRFTFASLATHGRDINFDVGRIQGYRNFCNKIWNASRYVIMNIDNSGIDITSGRMALNPAEQWINALFGKAINEINKGLRNYRFDLAARELYELTWDEYCDWYLELSKVTLNDPQAGEEYKRGTLFTLVNTLDILLRLAHPFMPFITEEIWQKLAPVLEKKSSSIMLESYPVPARATSDAGITKEMSWVKSFILAVRRIRSERDIPPGKRLAVLVTGGNRSEHGWLDKYGDYIMSLGKIDSVSRTGETTDDAVMALAGDMTLFVPLADLIDPEKEIAKLEKQLVKLKDDKERLHTKLSNRNFINRAPEEVVRKERERLQEIEIAVGKLEEQHRRILSLTD